MLSFCHNSRRDRQTDGRTYTSAIGRTGCILQRGKKHGSLRFYGELEELTHDDVWQIADAGDQELRRLAHSSRQDTLEELGAKDNDGIASLVYCAR